MLKFILVFHVDFLFSWSEFCNIVNNLIGKYVLFSKESEKATATCSACGAVVLRYNLKRHIQGHAELSPGRRTKVSLESSWKVVKSRTRQCTVKHCSALIQNLPRHLRVKHHITSETSLKEHLSLSRTQRRKAKR